MNKLIIGLVGQIASGKGTVAEYLKEQKNASIYRFSTVLREVLERLHSEITRENMQNLSTALRNSLGEDILAKVVAEDVCKDNNGVIIVDGIRRWADIKYLKELDGFVLTSIIATPETRYKRLINRSENKGDQKKTFDDFLADQEKEADAEIPKIIREAKENLDNEGELNYLYEQINKLISKYEK